MDRFLIAARALHFASTISLAGLFAFLCFVAAPQTSQPLCRRLSLLAWTSLVVALVSGIAWLLLLAAELSGKPLAAVLPQGVVATVLTRTRFGHIWLARFAFAVLLALCLVARRWWRGRGWSWAGLALGALMLATLAWAGHGGATPGRPGELHVAADCLHLLAAGAWLGSLIPLALLLAEARRIADPRWAALARRAVLRFSVLAVASVAILFAAGLINTWFLAGTVPALIGTPYGRLLLAKIAIFATMVTIAAVNLLRMAPRLAPAPGPAPDSARPLLWAAFGHLRRNALIEAFLGLIVLAIVGGLGILAPGLHTEPGWPLPFRVELDALAIPSAVLLAILLALAAACLVVTVAAGAAGHYRAMIAAAGTLALCLGLGAIVLRPALEPAFPTSFYAPAEPYAAASVMRGAGLYAENCALCHGADGKGDGPAASGLTPHPADLTAAHLLAHTEGDLYWWVGHGRANGAMPGFAGVMSPAERWDTINFIRARAAGVLSRRVGPLGSTAAAPAIPDFAFQSDGRQQTLRDVLATGPALVALFGRRPAAERLAQLAAQQRAIGGPRPLAIDLGPGPMPQAMEMPAPLVEVAADAAASLALFRTPGDDGETDLLLDRAGNLRARWTRSGPGGLPDAAALAAAAAHAARFAVMPASHAGHAH